MIVVSGGQGFFLPYGEKAMEVEVVEGGGQMQ